MRLIRLSFPSLFFIILTIVMTYPAILHLSTHIIADPGDALLNAWILAWDAHKILSGDLLSIFDANIFHPYKNTLAYSEHLLGLAPFATPIYAMTKNPVSTLNMTFLFCLTLSGITTYYLALFLTRHKAASLFAGIIFAYFPWRFSHLGHLQLQALQWFPIIFLCAHRLLETGRWRYLMGLYVFSMLQITSCGYYAMYLFLFVPLFFLLATPSILRGIPRSLIQIGIYFLMIFLTSIPFLWPYFQLKSEMNFSRSMDELYLYSADLLSYFCMAYPNRVWGHFQALIKPEAFLFTGFIPLIIGILGIIATVKERKAVSKKSNTPPWLRTIHPILNSLAIFYFLLTLWIICFGGFELSLFGIHASATKSAKTLMIFLYVMALKFILNRIQSLCHPQKSVPDPAISATFYLFLLVISFLLSLGPKITLQGQTLIQGLYGLLYHFFPGFTGLRVPARFVSLFVLALSIFAAFGFADLVKRIKHTVLRRIGIGIFFILLLLEITCIPIKIRFTPSGKSIPEEYLWLKNQPGNFAILELPLPQRSYQAHLEAKRVYFSTFHWKKLVNGYSGFFPASYTRLCAEFAEPMTSEEFIARVDKLDIRYILVHLDEFPDKTRELLFLIGLNPQRFEKTIEFPNAVVFKVNRD